MSHFLDSADLGWTIRKKQIFRPIARGGPKVTYSDPTHLPLPPPTSPGHHQVIRPVYWDLRVVVVVEGGNQL